MSKQYQKMKKKQFDLGYRKAREEIKEKIDKFVEENFYYDGDRIQSNWIECYNWKKALKELGLSEEEKSQ